MYIQEPVGKKNTYEVNKERVKRLLRRVRRYKANQYQRALHNRGWYDLSARSDYPAIFIGGCGRSGTTLLRELLNRHSRIFCGPETSFFGLPFAPQNIANMWGIEVEELDAEAARHNNLVSFVEWFFNKQISQAGKRRWADKTPNNVRSIGKILTQFPNSKFVHLIRDGRDVACSLRNHPREKIVNGKVVPNKVNRAISQCANRWLHDTSAGLVYREHPRYIELTYERLVEDPETCLIKLCNFVGEEFEPQMLQASQLDSDAYSAGRFVNNPNSGDTIQRSSIGRWEQDLDSKERVDFDNIAGELLYMLRYIDNRKWF